MAVFIASSNRFFKSKPLQYFFAFILLSVIGHSRLYSQSINDQNNTISQKNKDKTAENKPVYEGLQLPRLSELQRNAIISPAEGLMIFNTDTKRPQFYDGLGWINFSFDSNHYIGEQYGGGIIFYIDSSGRHGLIVSNVDLSKNAKWGFSDTAVHAFGKVIGTGKLNTSRILKLINTPNIAARLCVDFEYKGFKEWFLPSIEELNLIYKNLKLGKLVDFSEGNYWSSSETDFNNVWMQNFGKGYSQEQNENIPSYVRAIRAF